MHGESVIKKKTENGRNIVVLSIMMILLLIALCLILISKFEVNMNTITKFVSGQPLNMVYDEVKKGDENTNSDYVKFDAFFLDDIDGDDVADGIRGTCNAVGKEDTLYIELNVLGAGYLKDGKITIDSKNFYFNTAIPKDTEIKENYISPNTKTIELNQINNGTHKIISGEVRTGTYSADNSLWNSGTKDAIGYNGENYSRINTITLTGTHVQELADGTIQETKIEKSVNLQVDWYGEIDCQFYIPNRNQENQSDVIYDETKKELNVKFQIQVQDSKLQLLVEEFHIEGILPQINGYSPIRVEACDVDTTIEYDQNTRKYIVRDRAKAYGPYISTHINVVYPEQAYNAIKGTEATISIPVEIYLLGYNNPQEGYTNPYKSNVIKDTVKVKIEGKKPWVYLQIGNIIGDPYYQYVVSKEKPLKIYNGISSKEDEDYYNVSWNFYTEKINSNTGVILKETTNGSSQQVDKFNNGTISMENMLTNVGIQIYVDSTDIIEDDGYIKIYNDVTNEEVITITKQDLINNQRNIKINYTTPVKHIRIETSKLSNEKNLHITHTKKIDDEYITKNYTRAQFNQLSNIQTHVVAYIGNTLLDNRTASATYMEPFTAVTVSATPTAISTQENNENVVIKIAPYYDKYNKANWTNNTFLIKMPTDLINFKLNNISVLSADVEVISEEHYEINGVNFIKIKTKSNYVDPYAIVLNCNITVNRIMETSTKDVEVYVYNEAFPNYNYTEADIYDINENSNTTETVGKFTTQLTFQAPNSLLTNHQLENYDTKGSIAIAPNIAYITKSQRTAKVAIDLKNNYDGTISEITILGKMPTQGNTYAISQNALNSNYNTTMSNKGIILPNALKNTSKVYYSEQVNPTKDVNDSQNGWTTTPTDFSKVKSFLIELGTYVLQEKEYHQITYEINIPEGVEYNQVSYAHHGIYFSLDTGNGKYRTETEPSKLGICISKKYDFELTLYQQGVDTILPNATYEILEDGVILKTVTTNEDGKIQINDLFADKEYTIREIICPEGYRISAEDIKFEAREEAGELKIIITSGTPKRAEIIEDAYGEHALEIDLENALLVYEILLTSKYRPLANMNYIPFEWNINDSSPGYVYRLFQQNGDDISTITQVATSNSKTVVARTEQVKVALDSKTVTSWKVPEGITSITVTVAGAGGGGRWQIKIYSVRYIRIFKNFIL